MRVLVVEDDPKTVQALVSGLERESFAVASARSGEDAFFRLNTESFDLVILDWMLPGRDGVEILRALRARGTRTPVLLLTAREVIKLLTLITVVTPPPMLVGTWYGMNFEGIKEFNWKYGYQMAIGITVVSTALVVWWIKKKKWL